MDKKRLETTVDLSAERFGAVMGCISDGVFALGLGNRITCFNRAAEEMTGIPRDQALGRPCHKVLRADICREACPLRYTIETGQPVTNLEVTIHTPKFGLVPVSISTSLFKDKNGTLIGGAETFRDLRESWRCGKPSPRVILRGYCQQIKVDETIVRHAAHGGHQQQFSPDQRNAKGELHGKTISEF